MIKKIDNIAISICVVAAICYLFFSVNNAISDRNKEITTLTHESKIVIGSIATTYDHHLQLVKIAAEELLSENTQRNKIDKKRLINVKGKGWELVPNENEAFSLIGRTTGSGSVEDLSDEKIQEIFFSEKLYKIFTRTRANLPDAPYIYYISKEKFWSAVPRVLGDSVFFEDKYLNYEFYSLGLPPNNADGSLFWTKPYLDATGAGLMVTAGIPLYHQNEFKGTLCLDMLFNGVANYLKNPTFAQHHVSVVDNYNQIVSSTIQDLTNNNAIPTLPQLLNDDKANIQNFKENEFIWHGSTRVFASTVPRTQWKVLHFETRREFLSVVALRLFPVFSAVLFLMTIIYLLLYANRLRIENEAAKNNAEEAVSVRDKFTSLLAHDLRGAFSSIVVAAELLKDSIHEDSKEQIAKLVNRIHDTSKETHSLFEELLEWARAQQDHITFNPQKVQLSSLVNDGVRLLLDNAESKNVLITCNISGQIEIFTDKKMVDTIFRNLISNAIKFTPPSGQITLSATKQKKMVEVVVSDSGVGMDEETIQSLFKISETKSKTGTNGEMGIGFGLLLCKEFVERCGGEIWVESELGKGSDFKFTLPLSGDLGAGS